jgi:quercetin dioxygenase-like cupin family protein
MKRARVLASVFTIVVCAWVTAPSAPKPRATGSAQATPLIFEKNEGEHRLVRGWPGHPDPRESFILKVDPKNGGSSHLVLFTASLPHGNNIDPHKHPEADEILFLQTGTARVHLGTMTRDAHAGATVFILAGTTISVENIGNEPVDLVCIFSVPGFEEFLRDTTVREGEKNIPMSQAEDDAIEKKHAHAVVYQ